MLRCSTLSMLVLCLSSLSESPNYGLFFVGAYQKFKKGGIFNVNNLTNQNGNIRKVAWDLGMVFVIIILFVFLGIVLGPFTLPFVGRVLNFILGTFNM